MMIRVANYEWIDPVEIMHLTFKTLGANTFLCINFKCGDQVEISVEEDLSSSVDKIKYLIDAQRACTTGKESDIGYWNNPFYKDHWDMKFPMLT